MIYLDNAATTRPIKMKSEFDSDNIWLNGHSSYSNGDMVLWKCREIISSYINCEPNEIVFTSGGCEGNSFLIRVLCNYLDRSVFVSKREHKSVISNSRVWAINRFDELDWLIGIGNETGENNLDIIKDNDNIIGADLVQALPKCRIDVKELGLMGASFSGHKIHAPKGVGFVYISKELQEYAEPLIYGGAQEFGLRGGTSNVEAVVQMTERIKQLSLDIDKIEEYNKNMWNELCKQLAIREISCTFNHINFSNPSSTISMRIEGLEGQYIVNALAEKGIYISTGSACSTGEPSYVLKNMGLTNKEANSTIRVSFDYYENDYSDICEFVKGLEEIVNG